MSDNRVRVRLLKQCGKIDKPEARESENNGNTKALLSGSTVCLINDSLRVARAWDT